MGCGHLSVSESMPFSPVWTGPYSDYATIQAIPAHIFVSSREPEKEYFIRASLSRQSQNGGNIGCGCYSNFVASTSLVNIPLPDLMQRITLPQALTNVCPCRTAGARAFEPKRCVLSRFLERGSWTNLQEFPRFALSISLPKYTHLSQYLLCWILI